MVRKGRGQSKGKGRDESKVGERTK